MAKYQLSNGALLQICQGSQDVEHPIFQLLQTKKIAGTSTERYRMLISDGANSNSYGMLATQLNGFIHEERLKEYCIFKVNKYQCNNMQGKKVIIILDLEVLQEGSEVGAKIGSPIAIAADGTVSAQSADQNRAPNSNSVHSNNGDNKRVARSEAVGSPATKRPSMLDRPTGQGMPSNLAGAPIFPIASLTPYQNKWTIKARVTKKSDIRRWSNSRGEGHLFSMDLLDESGEIRATAFKNECDKFEPIVQEDKVYFISNCKLKPANKQYSNLNNDYELTFSEASELIPCNDKDTASIPRTQFNFAQLGQITAEHKDETVDVIGICRSASDVTNLTSSKTGKELTKRDLNIVDQSNVEMQLTIWGGHAENFNASGNPVVAVKGAKVSDFSGVSLTSMFGSTIMVNPDIPKCHELKGWYDQYGHNTDFKTMSQSGMGMGGGLPFGTNFKTIGEVKSSGLGMDNIKGEYYSTTATTVMFQKDKALYQACSQTNSDGKNCQKKVQDQGNGTYRCEKCNVDMDNFNWRIILSFSIADATDNQWVQCFHDQAESILKITAQELGTMQQADPEGYNRVFQEATFKKFNFRLRAKPDTYNDETRVRHAIISAEDVNFESYNKMMIKELNENGIELPMGVDESKYA